MSGGGGFPPFQLATPLPGPNGGPTLPMKELREENNAIEKT